MIDAAVTSAFANLQAQIAAVGTLQNASQSALAPILTAVNELLAAIDEECAAIEASIDESAVGGLHVGTPAPQLIATLVAQSSALTDLSNLHTMRGYVARVGVNIENAPG